MGFRITDPLPSYEEILTGKYSKFVVIAKEISSSSKENILNDDFTKIISISNSTDSFAIEEGNFKYKNINKINEEIEEGEITDEPLKELKTKKNNQEIKKNEKIGIISNRIPINTKDKERILKVQKPEAKPHSLNKNSTDLRSKLTVNSRNNFNNLNDSNITNIENKKKTHDSKKHMNDTEKTPFVPRLVCRYFMEGLCTKGNQCTFSHSVVPNKTQEEARVKEPCKFFIAGSCMKGESCYFSHDLSIVPCKFFHLKGECSASARGGECRFSHEAIDAVAYEKLRASENERIKEKAAAENLIAEQASINSTESLSLTTKYDHDQETETSTECPHVDLNINPFAGNDSEDF